ncbi:preprotein translocase subunit YajC [Cytophagaceae bacterium DM2B3-1]|uniref:Sec translocon accessory complex subunit YajC n=1 Tax=Xanthocytophaga flava TaxID=3048013 RepID=A0AAE3QNA2_9BACT|nr:preprotein translocase subunit YajC [Xanthocytophaga flavus]MDJ1468729.1 preprotein translocase subunit YajC [Xanthocytophaga flavus]MDJ1480175.1 preprotein translocase subunit YajC [Xanthocytophaga flavus]MDJ1495589.1 preprotein translocase subunit YajC [Xanthocytophaga flavus]
MNFTSVLLQAAGGGGGSTMLILMGAMFVVMYFFMIRPQQKRQKDAVKFRDSLKKGDMVVTIGGAHGKVVEVDNDTITLDIDRGVRVKFEKSAISQESSKKYAQTATTEVAETK